MTHRRAIHYRHPHFPAQVRLGYILTSGRDGHTVEHAESGREERVRHEDVVSEAHGVEADADEGGEGVGGDDGGGFEKSLAALMDDDALKRRAARYQDQYLPGHPARLHPDDLEWKLEPHFPLTALPGEKEDWAAWHTRSSRGLGYATQPPHQRLLNPIIAVLGHDGQHYIWDGNHRVAEMHHHDRHDIPAIVGRPKNAKLPLPPGSEGRTGIRKSLYARKPLPLFLKATGAYAKLRQKTSAHQVMSRLKANARAGQPGAGAAGRDALGARKHGKGGGGKPGAAAEGVQWQVPGQPRPSHEVGQEVHYQRHDMHEPRIGRIEALGKDGAVVSHPDGTRHKVRHEHILGSSMDGLPPDAHQQAAEDLRGAGAPIDPLEQYLLPERHQRPTAQTMERLKALLADGAPLDMARLADAPEADARKVIEHFAGKIDHGDGQAPVVRRKKQAGGATLRDPYKEDG